MKVPGRCMKVPWNAFLYCEYVIKRKLSKVVNRLPNTHAECYTAISP